MKKISHFIFIVVALLVFAPSGHAQEETVIKDGMGYSKKISRPDDDGVYTITLEAFTTGSVKVSQESLPADIVLVLDISGSMGNNFGGGQTRLAALKTAVNGFIDQINTNDIEHAPEGQARLGNRIAIVTFSTNATVRDELTPLSGNGVDDLKGTINRLTANGSTYSHRGMKEAYDLLRVLPATRRLRTVVLFTDGEPGYYATGNWTGTQWVTNSDWGTGRFQQRVDAFNTANAAISYANDIKNLATSTNGVIANVFTVSIIGNPSRQTQVYLGKLSSNWLKSTSMGEWNDDWGNDNTMWNNGNGQRNPETLDSVPAEKRKNFALTANSTAELIQAFETIGQSSGGSSRPLPEGSVTAVDIVSASFMLPEGTDATGIKVYTSPCTVTGPSAPITFGADVLTPFSNTEDGGIDTTTDRYTKKVDEGLPTERYKSFDCDSALTVALSKSSPSMTKNDVITVNGFDYSGNWCGYDDANKVAHGRRLIIEIPVKMDPQAVGGPGVDTNAEGSGIWADLDGNPDTPPVNVAPFVSPVVDLPVNIHILKMGLKLNESAKFKIQRIDKANPDATNWEDVTTVFITKTSETEEPLVKIRGLDPNYIYQIVEEDWSWSYTKTANTPTRTDKFKLNPFRFTNNPITDMDQKIRHAESKATNDFSGSGSATYVDSKDNGR